MPSIALCTPGGGGGDGIEWEVNKLLTRADGQVVDTQERATATLASIVRSSVDNMDQLAVSSFFAIKNKRIRRAIFLCR